MILKNRLSDIKVNTPMSDFYKKYSGENIWLLLDEYNLTFVQEVKMPF